MGYWVAFEGTAMGIAAVWNGPDMMIVEMVSLLREDDEAEKCPNVVTSIRRGKTWYSVIVEDNCLILEWYSI